MPTIEVSSTAAEAPPLPRDLAGYQNVRMDCVREWDVIVDAAGDFSWGHRGYMGLPVDVDGYLVGLSGCRLYRKIPVAKQGVDERSRVLAMAESPREESPRSNLAGEAIKLVLVDRNDSYGNPRDDYEGTAKIWSGLLRAKLKADITPEEAILMMVGLKLNREAHKHKDDNLVDAHGYLLCLEWALTGKRPQA